MRMRNAFWVAFAVAVAAFAGDAVQAANMLDRPCKTWVDPVLRVEFPGQLADLQLTWRRLFKSGGNRYSLRYDSAESAKAKIGGRHLDLFIYAREGKPISDGTDERVAEELDGADEQLDAATVREHLAAPVKRLGVYAGGVLARSRLKYQWTSYVVKLIERPEAYSSITVVTAFRNRFVKLRYSEADSNGDIEPCSELPRSVLTILDAIDALFADAIAAAKVDVYAIANPTNALAALRRKWRGADARASMWDMPDYEERFFEIDKLQDWCGENTKERYGYFKDAVLAAVDMRLEPSIWFYNLACARAVLGEDRDSVFDALEQAVVAGYNNASHALADSDFASVTNDVRFLKLCGIMEAVHGNRNWPKSPLREDGNRYLLSDDNVFYGFKDYSYLCCLETTNCCPIVYVNHHKSHDAVPCNGLIAPEFPSEAVERRRNIGVANMHFLDARTGICHPTVVASDYAIKEDRLNRSMGIPALLGCSSRVASVEVLHCDMWNVLGVYAAASDYGVDGIDRFIGYWPCCIAHSGGADESDKFVRLYADIVRALSPLDRGGASVAALNIIRHAQKCVTNEASFMSGIAQRPVISFEDIDVEKAISDAKTVKFIPRVPFIEDVSCVSEATAATELLEEPHVASSVHNAAFVATWGEKTGVLDVKMDVPSESDLVWKVLQGDEGKVRIVPQEEGARHVRIEVDYHKVFDVALPNGTTVKSSRVDVGCFGVDRGRASVPAVVSVYFSPNETREYSADGKLVSIDYTKRQLDGWRPQQCAKGKWKDVFHYTPDGKMAGWTRLTPDENGSVATNEFTCEGLVVMTRDSLGRPNDVRLDMRMIWSQDFAGVALSGDEYLAHITRKGIEFDQDDRPPEETTLAWQYSYSDGSDFIGEPSPKPVKPFSYKPGMCSRADFSAGSGFRFPLVDQMMAGQARYAGFKYGSIDDGDTRDLVREDSPLALKDRGLTPPKMLRKMTFCPWKPSTNDLWTVDVRDCEDFVLSNLVELADGAYRLHSNKQGRWLSVKETYTLVNDTIEDCAYARLDKAFVRGEKQELEDSRMVVAGRAPLRKEDLPEGASVSMAFWEISEKVWLCIQAFHDTGFTSRDYGFYGSEESILSEIHFDELPSRAVGNTVLRAYEGDAEAMNNLAVLLYAEVANRGSYSEATVADILKRAAEKGCATARRNLEVLRYNRGEKDQQSHSIPK